MSIASYVVHPIPPLYNAASRVLILGSFPSVASRDAGFFYGHPQNRFWRVMAAVLAAPVPSTVEEKKELLLSHGIALWDTVASCRIRGSADASITDVVPNDLSPILARADIRLIVTNGKTSDAYYQKYIAPKVEIPALCLPSTSPANASFSLDRLCAAWSVIRNFLS